LAKGVQDPSLPFTIYPLKTKGREIQGFDTRVHNPDRYALIIDGIDDASVSEARRLQEVLRKKFPEVPEGNFRLLQNPTKAEVEEALATLQNQLSADSELFIPFIGHGYQEMPSEVTKPKQGDGLAYMVSKDRGINEWDFQKWDNALPPGVRTTYWNFACNSGAFIADAPVLQAPTIG
jgi:hypothetical protein